VLEWGGRGGRSEHGSRVEASASQPSAPLRLRSGPAPPPAATVAAVAARAVCGPFSCSFQNRDLGPDVRSLLDRPTGHPTGGEPRPSSPTVGDRRRRGSNTRSRLLCE